MLHHEALARDTDIPSTGTRHGHPGVTVSPRHFPSLPRSGTQARHKLTHTPAGLELVHPRLIQRRAAPHTHTHTVGRRVEHAMALRHMHTTHAKRETRDASWDTNAHPQQQTKLSQQTDTGPTPLLSTPNSRHLHPNQAHVQHTVSAAHYLFHHTSPRFPTQGLHKPRNGRSPTRHEHGHGT